MPDSDIRGQSDSSPPSSFTVGGLPVSRRISTFATTALGAAVVVAVRSCRCATTSPGVHVASPSPTRPVVPVRSSVASKRTCVTVICVGFGVWPPGASSPLPPVFQRSSMSRTLSLPSLPRRSVAITPSTLASPSSIAPDQRIPGVEVDVDPIDVNERRVAVERSAHRQVADRRVAERARRIEPMSISRPSLAASRSERRLRISYAPSLRIDHREREQHQNPEPADDGAGDPPASRDRPRQRRGDRMLHRRIQQRASAIAHLQTSARMCPSSLTLWPHTTQSPDRHVLFVVEHALAVGTVDRDGELEALVGAIAEQDRRGALAELERLAP